jgi:hypothetical protein
MLVVVSRNIVIQVVQNESSPYGCSSYVVCAWFRIRSIS